MINLGFELLLLWLKSHIRCFYCVLKNKAESIVIDFVKTDFGKWFRKTMCLGERRGNFWLSVHWVLNLFFSKHSGKGGKKTNNECPSPCQNCSFLKSKPPSMLKPLYNEQVHWILFVHYTEKFTISNVIFLIDPQNGSWVLFNISRNSLYQAIKVPYIEVSVYF